MRRPLLALCLTLVLAVGGFFLIFPQSPPSLTGENQTVYLSGKVAAKEYRTSYGKKQCILTISDCEILTVSDFEAGQINTTPQQWNILCYLQDITMEPKMGSRVVLKGSLSAMSVATNPGEFDSRSYYYVEKILGRLSKGILVEESHSFSWFLEGLWQLRKHAEEKLDHLFPTREASLLKTMLLGSRETLEGEVKETYQRSGIAHILAISGLHISLIGMGIYGFLGRMGMPRKVAAIISVVALIIYGIFAGGGVSLCRAVFMFLFRMVGELLGRTYDMSTALGIVMAGMVLMQPLYLTHSGFLLSFSSILGLGVLFPVLQGERKRPTRYEEKLPKKIRVLREKVRSAFLAGASVTLVTLPTTMCFFYQVPVYGVLFNLVVVPLMTVLMGCGFLLLFLPVKWSFLVVPPTILGNGIFGLYDGICALSEQLPGSLWITGKPEEWQIVGFVGLLFLVVCLGKKTCFWKKGILLLGALFLLSFRVQEGFRVTFLDVGQGDGICVEMGDGTVYLIDGGSTDKSDVGKYQMLPFLKSRGIGKILGIFISHPDQDHWNGLTGLLEGGYGNRIGMILLPQVVKENKNESYLAIENLAKEYGILVGYLAAGMSWSQGEVNFTCLHPPAEYDQQESNVYSQVLYLQKGDFSLLLTGDVEKAGEEKLLAALKNQKITEVTVLKVAHHGSGYATGAEFLEQISPKIGVISCGQNNSYGHPHQDTLDRLFERKVQVFQTPKTGACWVYERKGEFFWKTYF